MPVTIPEPDWKKFKPLREKALTRLCDRTLEEIDTIKAKSNLSSHEQYLEIYSLMRDRNRELGEIFDRFSRSGALLQLGMMQSRGLITLEEIDRFSESTREYLEKLRW